MALDLCLYTDSVPDLSLGQALDFAVSIGARAVEIAAGGQSSAPHMRVFELLDDPARRQAFVRELEARDLRLAAVNCSAWPMHPQYGERHLEIMRAAVRLAGELGVDKIVTMSGLPGDGPASRIINWVTYPWPPDAYAVLEEQWQMALEVWGEFAEYARSHGIRRIALELHPLQLAYNVPTLRRLRDATGPIVGANVDPSHMFWQQMDPVAVVKDLGEAVHHVHLKDVEFRPSELALAGVIDARPFTTPEHRSWIFRTVGHGHGTDFWQPFLASLGEIGYDDVVSIENEDPIQTAEEGVRDAADFVRPLLTGAAEGAS